MAELDLGRIRFFDKGEHSMETEYVLWDFVTSGGSTHLYINKANSTGKPLTDEFYWKCLAKRGLSAFEVWDIMNGGKKTEAQFFGFIQSPANDAKDDYYDVVKPDIIAQGEYATAQGDYAKAQGEAVEGTVSSINNNTLTIEEVTAMAIVAMQNRIVALEKILSEGILDKIKIMNLDIIDNFNVWGQSNLILTGNSAPNVIPDFTGQTFIDTTNKVAYTATGNNSVLDWK